MSDLDEISIAIGRLQAAQESHAEASREFRERVTARLDVIEAKVDPLVAYRNKLLGGAAVIATGMGMVAPWLKRLIGGN